MNSLTNYLKVGHFSDEFLEKLEKEYTELSVVYESLEIKKEPESTPKDDEPIDLDKVSKLF